MQLITPLEGFDVQDFAKGTSEAKQYAVSFYIKTNVTGNYALQITDDNGRSCSKLYTVSDANWNRYTVIFPADTTGAIDNDNTEGLRLTWHLVVGTDRTSGTMNTTWAATTTANIAAGQNANVASSTSNNWYITGVQLEVGSVATDFEHRSFDIERDLCRRYFQRFNFTAANSCISLGYIENSTQARMPFQFFKEMRDAPTFAVSSAAAFDAANGNQSRTASGIVISNANACGCILIATTGSGLTESTNGVLLRNTSAPQHFDFSSEL